MASWGKWLLSSGFVAAGMTVVSGILQFGPIADDVSGRARADLAAKGNPWAKVAIDGRDVTLSGVAPSPEARTLASEATDRVFGVRVVADAATLLPLASPYVFSADKAETLRLAGTIPGDEARAAVTAAAVAAMPGVAIEDALTAARGAPAAFVDWTRFALLQAAGLQSGKVSISDGAYSIAGTPKDYATWEKLQAGLAALPAGLKLATVDLAVPVPPRWSLDLSAAAGRARLDGFLPDAATRARLLAALKSAFPGGVEDHTRLAPGARAGIAAALDWSTATLAAIGDGKITLAPEGLSIGGTPKDWATWNGIETQLKAGVPGGLPLVADTLVAPVPVPYRLGLTSRGAMATLDGFLPDAAARDRLLAALRQRFTAGVDDRTAIAPGAPGGFVDAVLAILPGLGRLADGGFEISGTSFGLKGGAPTQAILDQIVARVRGLLPKGFALADGAGTSVLPPPPQIGAAECQAGLARVQTGEKILFETGKAVLSPASERVLDTLVFGALACLDAHVTVEGHTDSDGDPDANQSLSERRAAAVVDYLATAGIARDRLTAIGWGETHPIADNATPEGRQANRRIDFRVE